MHNKFRDEFNNPNFRKIRELEEEITDLGTTIEQDLFRQVIKKSAKAEDRLPEKTPELRQWINAYFGKLRQSMNTVTENLGLNKATPPQSGSVESMLQNKEKFAPKDDIYQSL